MKLLFALDMSTNVGWARMRRYEPPTFGTLPLKGDTSTKIGSFSVWLDEQFAVAPFDGLAWERPLLLRTDTVQLLELLYGLVGVAHAFRWRRSLPYRDIDVSTVKIALTGSARADKDMMVVGAMQTMGWEIEDHHQADAGGVGLVAYDQLWPKG
jgi:Holliday junction resolvasome RuvABC endonuclease subunit